MEAKDPESRELPKGRWRAALASLVKRARIPLISAVLGIGAGVLMGALLTRASLALDGLFSLVYGVLAYGATHVIERAYHYWRVPRSMAHWGIEYEEKAFETIRAGIRFAECQVGMAHMIDRCPKPFEDVVMLTSELGYVLHRETLRHAEEAGIIPAICWHARPTIDGAPRSETACDGEADPASFIDTTAVSIPPLSMPGSEVELDGFERRAPLILPVQAGPSSGAGSGSSGAGSGTSARSSSGSKYTMRAGKLVLR